MPVRFGGGMCSRMARGDSSLQNVRSWLLAQALRAGKRRQTAANEQLVPQSPILLEQENRFPGWANAGLRARCLYLHESDQPVDFRLLRHKLSQNSAQAEGFLAERGTHPVIASSGCVAFIKDQIDDGEYGREAGRTVAAAWQLERNLFLGQRALGAHDTLRDRRLRHEKRARDLLRGEAPE